MRSARLLSLVVVLLAGEAKAQTRSVDDLVRKAEAVKAKAEESRWMRIPWLTSAAEAQRVARQEQRPILYWNVDDDPLERC